VDTRWHLRVEVVISTFPNICQHQNKGKPLHENNVRKVKVLIEVSKSDFISKTGGNIHFLHARFPPLFCNTVSKNRIDVYLRVAFMHGYHGRYTIGKPKLNPQRTQNFYDARFPKVCEVLLDSICRVLRSSDCKHSVPKVLRTGENSRILEKLLEIKWHTARDHLRVEATVVFKTNLACAAYTER
jgi:hypothetical protein